MPIFELPLAALPSERLPLHIFEQRYRAMIADCLEHEREFGIVLRTESGVARVGCAVEIAEVLERFDDGRMNILVTGLYRFRVLDRRDGADYPVGTVQRLAEPEDAGADPGAALESFGRLLSAVDPEASTPASLRTAFEIAARVEIPVEIKQRLLESESEPDRLDLLANAIDKLVAELDRSRKIGDLARGNGHSPGSVPPPPSD